MAEKNKGGRPPKDEAATARAVELCLTEGINPIEACGRVPGATQRTVYLHLERIRKGKMPAPKISRIEVAPELVVMTGIPASGKSTIVRERYGGSHVVVSRDAIGGSVAALEAVVETELRAGRSVVLDVTAPARSDRAPWVALARRCGARAVSMFVESSKAGAIARNAKREGSARVHVAAIHAIFSKLEEPTVDEGFDEVLKSSVESRIEVAPEPRPDPLKAIVSSPDVRAAVTVAADPERARAVRRLVQGMGGKWDGEAVEALAATWGCSVDAVRALVIEAAILAGAQVLPPELAREESLAVARRARDKAETAADWKSVLLAQAHIDGIQLRAKEGEGLTKAQFVALAREILEAVKPFPGAYEAAIGVMFPG